MSLKGKRLGFISNLIVYVSIIILIQYVLTESFLNMGLKDVARLDIYFGENRSASISVLLHLIPLNVALIFLMDWIYLMRYMPVRLHKEAHYRKAAPQFRASKAKLMLEKVSHSCAGFKYSLGIILLFGFLSLSLLALMCPSAFYNFAENLYWKSEPFRSIVAWTAQINSSLIKALGQLAISFRSSMAVLIGPSIESVVKLDITWKYLLCQNIASWTTTLFALSYARHHRAKKRVR